MTTAQSFVGTSGWSHADWVGPLSPAGTAPGEHLARCCRECWAVEIGSTFYRIPTARVVDGWKAASPDGFRFMPKAPQLITHERRLRVCAAEFAPDRELNPWTERVRDYRARGVTVFAFANNRYQGHGAATARAHQSRLAAPASSS